jgi:glycolate oxidase iron-sulfur subunit
MSTTLRETARPDSPAPAATASFTEKFAEYTRTLDCVHCGLCIPHCPTHGVSGREADSPRGRIYLMRAWGESTLDLSEEAQLHLDRCIVCRACESVCPSGIQMGEMMESFRHEIRERRPPRGLAAALSNHFLGKIVPDRRRIERLSDTLEIYQRSGAAAVMGLLLRLVPPLGRIHALQPRIPPRRVRRIAQAAPPPALESPRARAALFLGCVAAEWFAPVHHATMRVLHKNGIDVVIPQGQGCCGALHRHAGLLPDAKALWEHNAEVFRDASVDAVVVNAAGCGASLKEPPGHLPPFAVPVRDIMEFLHETGFTAPLRPLPWKITIDQPCHLVHGQRVRSEVVENLLKRIPSLEIVPLRNSERCCGAGGTYNLFHPEMAEPILDDKIHAIQETGAAVVVTGNPGCAMQIRYGLDRKGLRHVQVLHPIEILDRALE